MGSLLARRSGRNLSSPLRCQVTTICRYASYGREVRLSQHFAPTLRPEAVGSEQVESVALLLRGGYIRQSSSGFYSLLPNGLRVVRKIEKMVDEEMSSIGASRLELPAVLHSALWHKSGRFDTIGSELYKLNDRRGTEYVLAPTFEEEVTKLVGEEVQSWKQLPVKIYQITNKFRDEPRPRSGLLRTRSFLMKDLYTFDVSPDEARKSYEQVSMAYARLMTRLFGIVGRGWRVAEADTGAMGGAMSQEYQVPDELGEDELIVCSSCTYSANKEKAVSLPKRIGLPVDADQVHVSLYGLSDPSLHGCTLTAFISSKQRVSNPLKVRHHLMSNNSDTRQEASLLHPGQGETKWDWKERPEGPMVRFDRIRVLLDHECMALDPEEIQSALLHAIETYGSPLIADVGNRPPGSPVLQDYFAAQFSSPSDALPVEIVDVRESEHGDACAMCREGHLEQIKTVEVGHTFLLGSRYSDALGYKVASTGPEMQPLQMGCYGIGISRIFGVLAQSAMRQFSQLQPNSGRQRAGFAWSEDVAPFRLLILPSEHVAQSEAINKLIKSIQSGMLHATLGKSVGPMNAFDASDVAIDDRDTLSFGAKLNEADLIGYPVILLLGKHFKSTGEVEVRSRSDKSWNTFYIPLSSFQAAS